MTKLIVAFRNFANEFEKLLDKKFAGGSYANMQVVQISQCNFLLIRGFFGWAGFAGCFMFRLLLMYSVCEHDGTLLQVNFFSKWSMTSRKPFMLKN
jgi:hypothetical protein